MSVAIAAIVAPTVVAPIVVAPAIIATGYRTIRRRVVVARACDPAVGVRVVIGPVRVRTIVSSGYDATITISPKTVSKRFGSNRERE
jgi:hypothetical protein